MNDDLIQTSTTPAEVKYEIRGQLAHRAHEKDVFPRIDSLLEQHAD